MSLDGLRAWVGEVERKLGMRTRVFLVLAAIAVGGAGAAIYLALDASDKATGEADVSALEARIEQLEAEQATTEPAIAPLEAQIEELRRQVEQVEGKGTTGATGATGPAGTTGPADEAESAPEKAPSGREAK